MSQNVKSLVQASKNKADIIESKLIKWTKEGTDELQQNKNLLF